MNILVTGANGFVGHSLIPILLKAGHQVTALVRSKKKTDNKLTGVHWIEGNLLKAESLPHLPKIDKAFYLVHGLNEDNSAFEYQESLAAVHFVNWIRPTGASIIYLGALAPRDQLLSPHLRSRHLTGAILGASGLATIEFRASIVLGAGSLSFEMIKALSERLPIRPEMALLSQPCQPISHSDLLQYLLAAVDHQTSGHKIYEIGGPDVLSYGELMDMYTEISGLRKKRIKLPEVDAKVLAKALDYAIPEHAHAGKKLTESLEYPTIVNHREALKDFPDIRPEKLKAAMTEAEQASKTTYAQLWDKDFLRTLLSDKILTQSGLLSPDLMRNVEKMAKFKDIFLKNKT